jgi:hypothetical protein
MKKAKTKLTSDLNDKEMFKFQGETTNYEVVDWVYYRKVGSKKKQILPINKYVIVWKTL